MNELPYSLVAFKLGKLLIDAGLITDSQLNNALKAQKTYGGKLGTNLIELGFLSDEDLVEILAKQFQMQSAKAVEFQAIPRHVIKVIPKDIAMAHKVIPIAADGPVKVAFSDPSDIHALNTFALKANIRVQPVIAPEIWIVSALETYYGVQRDSRYIMLDGTAIEGNFEITPGLSDYDSLYAETSLAEATVTVDAAPAAAEEMSVPVFLEKLENQISSKDVCVTLFEFLSPYFAQMALFTKKGEEICGSMLSGFPIHTKSFTEKTCPVAKAYLLGQIANQQTPYVGLITAVDPESKLFEGLNIPKDKKVGIYPISVRQKTLGLLLGVPQMTTLPKPMAGKTVSMAIQKAALALELLQIKKELRKV